MISRFFCITNVACLDFKHLWMLRKERSRTKKDAFRDVIHFEYTNYTFKKKVEMMHSGKKLLP